MSGVPQWVLLADASVSSLDVSEPTAGLGLERASPYFVSRVRVRKNLATSTVEAARGDRAFARRVLAPGNSDFSLSARVEYTRWGYYRCTDCSKPTDAEKGIHTKVSWGGYGGAEVGETLFTATQPDESTVSHRAVPLAVSLGAVVRLQGEMPEGAKVLGSGNLMLSPYLGGTLRMIGGDLGEGDRMTTIGSPTKYLGGAEIGIGIQFGNIILDPKLTFLSNGRDPDVDGLSGLQFQINISFVLPWTVLGADKPEAQKEAEAAKKRADEATKTSELQKEAVEERAKALKLQLETLKAFGPKSIKRLESIERNEGLEDAPPPPKTEKPEPTAAARD